MEIIQYKFKKFSKIVADLCKIGITESVFSSLKRKYGSRLRARKYKTQKIELLCKVLSYNIERAIRIAMFIVKYYLAILRSLL